jgi:cytochrome P450
VTEAIELPTARNNPFDPPPLLSSLRAELPICRLRYPDGHIGWLVTGHQLARAVLTDARFGVAPTQGPVDDPRALAELRHAFKASRLDLAMLLSVDPPEHTRYRSLLSRRFTASAVEKYRAGLEHIVDARLDDMERTEPPVDIVQTFALPIDLGAHCLMLGLPESDAAFLYELDAAVSGKFDRAEVRRVLNEFHDFVGPVIQRKRHEPDDGVISHIVATRELNEDELRSLILFMCVAGVVTSAETLAFSVLALLCHPGQFEVLRTDQALIDSAVDELLRYVTVFATSATRRALEEVELGGVTIGTGECVTVSNAAGNRDPQRFDSPDDLDIRRSIRGHLAFGQGIHTCLGQHLARLELRTALKGIVRRFPTLRLAVPVGELNLRNGFQGTEYSIDELPVTWP